MIRIENVDVWGFEHAVRGMRNPYNSWNKSDSEYEPANFCDSNFILGDADLGLMRKLYNAGPEHRKFLRQIFVSMDVTAPLYWWKEFDTYKVGTVANSCSTMHKIHAKEFYPNDFSREHLIIDDAKTELLSGGNDTGILVSPDNLLNITIGCLNNYRKKYLETKDKKWWWQMIQLLPSSYNQRRTVTMNYENAVNIIRQRKAHRLDEWRVFCGELADLPHVKEIMEVGSDGR